MRTNVPRLITAFYAEHPDPAEVSHRVSFGTSGHRGVSTKRSFNEDHILAITQALVEYRAGEGISGPLFLGMDPHALSEPAHAVALEVLAANGVQVRYQADGGYTPTPVISQAILAFNRANAGPRADGVVITPSHNPPDNGGFKYNPPHGGPADSDVTGWIQERANRLLEGGLSGVKRVTLAAAQRTDGVQEVDFVEPYVEGLGGVVDLEAVRESGLRLGVDPMGGAGLAYWAPIADRYGLDLELVHQEFDPTFQFMTVDKDGKIRMDCSSPHAMARLVSLRDRFDLAFGNDPDYDRHGIVTPAGLMNPNHYLATMIAYLFTHRPGWSAAAGVGKTLVSSSMIDRVADDLGRRLVEVPVGFKWFVSGLLEGDLGYGGEESAGASFLDREGQAWSTDKDGIIADLLAAEMTARTGKNPSDHYIELTGRFGEPVYERIDAPATRSQKAALKALAPEQVDATELAGQPIVARLTRAPGNDAAIGGLKVTTADGWFAARPSGTEDVYKIYAESFLGREHLAAIQQEARAIVAAAFHAAGA